MVTHQSSFLSGREKQDGVFSSILKAVPKMACSSMEERIATNDAIKVRIFSSQQNRCRSAEILRSGSRGRWFECSQHSIKENGNMNALAQPGRAGERKPLYEYSPVNFGWIAQWSRTLTGLRRWLKVRVFFHPLTHNTPTQLEKIWQV